MQATESESFWPVVEASVQHLAVIFSDWIHIFFMFLKDHTSFTEHVIFPSIYRHESSDITLKHDPKCFHVNWGISQADLKSISHFTSIVINGWLFCLLLIFAVNLLNYENWDTNKHSDIPCDLTWSSTFSSQGAVNTHSGEGYDRINGNI